MTAALLHEWLLAGHMIDRAGMPHLIAELGREGMTAIAIEEWMGASPVYTRRMQRALGFGPAARPDDDGVEAIFKGLQLDIGAPPQFMDFRYRVDDDEHGEFWLASCGALLDVEPLGDDFVVAMCHHIEDPTFDATAIATNPRAQVRPVHRPPRADEAREGHHEHCRWTVQIVAGAEPLPEPAAAEALGSSRAATVELSPVADGDDYAGPFDPDFHRHLDRFRPATLRRLLDEVALQGHLLARSFMLAVASRLGEADAARLGARQLTGVGGLTSARLARHLAVDIGHDGQGGGADGVAAVLAVHPALHPRPYVDVDVERTGDDTLRVALRGGAFEQEGDDLSWPAVLAAHPEALEAIVRGSDPRASVQDDGDRTWTVTVDPAADPAPEADDVVLASFSGGARFEFS